MRVNNANMKEALVVEPLNKEQVRRAVERRNPTAVPLMLHKWWNSETADKYGARLRKAKQIPGKTDRGDAMSALRDELLAEVCPDGVEEPKYPSFSRRCR